MYYPYLRGKQYELITVRENAQRMKEAGFVPIIEPVKESLGGLVKALKAIDDAAGTAIVIVNPFHGVHAGGGDGISGLLEDYLGKPDICAGILLTPEMTVDEVVGIVDQHQAHTVTLIHAGFTQGKALAQAIGDKNILRHVFIGDEERLYRRHFRDTSQVQVKDGFRRRQRNQDYPPIEFFSELHATFQEMGLDGFGDFLTVGDKFQEGGGPAYAIAIHLTFIDPDDDDRMFIYHFKSLRYDTPTDPAGKFAEALASLVQTLDRPDSKVLESQAVQEFRNLHARGHFPGLGYVKKLSMQHHIETMAAYFEE